MPKTLTSFTQSDRAAGDYFSGLILQDPIDKNVWIPGDPPVAATDIAAANAGKSTELVNSEGQSNAISPSATVLGAAPHNILTGYGIDVASGGGVKIALPVGETEIKIWLKATPARVTFALIGSGEVYTKVWDLAAAEFQDSSIAIAGSITVEEIEMKDYGEAGSLAHLKLTLPVALDLRLAAYTATPDAVQPWSGDVAYEIIEPEILAKIEDIDDTMLRETDARFSIPYPDFIESITFTLGDRRSEHHPARTFDVTFDAITGFNANGNAKSTVGDWGVSGSGIWRQWQRTHTIAGAAYTWDFYHHTDAAHMHVSIQDTHSGRANTYGAVRGYKVKYKPYPGITEIPIVIDPTLIVPEDEVRYRLLISQEPIAGSNRFNPIGTHFNTVSAHAIGGSFQVGDRITLYCDIGTLVAIRYEAGNQELSYYGRDQRTQSTNTRTGIRINNGFIQHRGVDTTAGAIRWVTVERRIESKSVTSVTEITDTRPEVISTYEFTFNNVGNSAGEYFIANWESMEAAGYVYGGSTLSAFVDTDSWITPPAYIGSNHAALGCRYSLNTRGDYKANFWQKGTELFGKLARLQITWVKDSNILR